MDDSLVEYIERQIMRDIQHAEDFIDPRSASPVLDRDSVTVELRHIRNQISGALGTTGENRIMHIRMAARLLADLEKRTRGQ